MVVAFWNVTLCSLLDMYKHFRETCCPHLHPSSTLKIETAVSKTVVPIYQPARRHISGDHNLNTHHCKNPKSLNIYCFFHYLQYFIYTWEYILNNKPEILYILV